MLTWLRCSSLDILEEYGLHSLVTYMSSWPQNYLNIQITKARVQQHPFRTASEHIRNTSRVFHHDRIIFLTLWVWTILYYLLPFRFRAMLLLTHCLSLFPLFVGVCIWSLFCNAVLSVISRFAIISHGLRIRIYHECEVRPEDRRWASRGLPNDDKRWSWGTDFSILPSHE